MASPMSRNVGPVANLRPVANRPADAYRSPNQRRFAQASSLPHKR
jgi:hypothetical protein